MSSSDESTNPAHMSSPPRSHKRTHAHSISPPPLKRKRQAPSSTTSTPPPSENTISLSAAIEAGRIQITDHLSHFSNLLSAHTLSPYPPGTPHLPVPAYASLYSSCHLNLSGAHFVIHQHDHPIAGTHYDLRLQINGTSSASWAIMKGPPGNPNSKRLGRNATETRIHCLWNHLVESGSAATGSLIVWDTGRYEVLPKEDEIRRMKKTKGQETDEEGSQPTAGVGREEVVVTEPEKLAAAFRARRIRLRLHGSKLPRGYTVHMRLSVEDDVEGQAKARREVEGSRRRRSVRGTPRKRAGGYMDSEDEEEEGEDEVAATPQAAAPGDEALSSMEKELRELEDETVRRTNAYPGADNTVGSVHQRRWFMSLDRLGSGFVKRKVEGRTKWVKDLESRPLEEEGDEDRLKWPFVIKGSEYERSVVTGRLGNDVLRDEGVTDFRHRKGWRPILD